MDFIFSPFDDLLARHDGRHDDSKSKGVRVKVHFVQQILCLSLQMSKYLKKKGVHWSGHFVCLYTRVLGRAAQHSKQQLSAELQLDNTEAVDIDFTTKPKEQVKKNQFFCEKKKSLSNPFLPALHVSFWKPYN